MKKRLRLDLNGLRFNIWFYFIIYALIIIGLLWLLQVVFLQAYYESMRKREIKRFGNEMIAAYLTSPDSLEQINEVAVSNGVTFLVLNSFFQPLPGHFQVSILDYPLLQKSLIDFGMQAAANLASGKTEFDYLEDSLGGNAMVYGRGVGSGTERLWFYFKAQLAPVDTTTRVLQNQLWIVTAALIVIGFVISVYISGKLGKPIAAISHQAQRLGQGDYEGVFSGNGVTEIDELSDTLNYVREELQKTDDLRKELMANVSHDLRTPLTMVKAYAEMIRDISGDDKAKREQHAEVIIEEADRLSLLVNDILNLSRLERGNLPMNLQDFDLSKACGTVVNHFSYLEEREGYRFTGRIQPDLTVHADPGQIGQVMYNLISNAVNYTGDDKRVMIRLYRREDKVRFEVQDTGPGIPEGERKGIWDRYYRSKETHKRPVVGTGLGLSIVKNVLLAHKADFGVDSPPEGGSLFWFELAAN